MTVESDIYALLNPLVSGRLFPDVAPAGTVAPWGVYQQLGGEASTLITRTVSAKQNGRFQVSFWAKTRSEAAALALDAEHLMTLATDFEARPVGAPLAVYELDTLLYGTHQHFSVWSDR
jgi:hypothetical protein